MGIARECYNPAIFKPGNAPLLSLAQWQALQLYLVDAMNLSAAAQMKLPADVISIYKDLSAQAVTFHAETLSQAQVVGNTLYRYGREASLTFEAVVKLMDQRTPNKDAILQALGNLQQGAEKNKSLAQGVSGGIASFITATKQDSGNLELAAARETQLVSADNLSVTKLQTRYNGLFSDKQQAQAAILSDQGTIDNAKYYIWIPFIGTAIALGKISSANEDIREQIARINADVGEMQSIQEQIQAINLEISHLTYAVQYNQHMIGEIDRAMRGSELIQGAWKTIASELGLVVQNVASATAEQLANNPCLGAISLSTAASEWADIAQDAQKFMLNFYVREEEAA